MSWKLLIFCIIHWTNQKLVKLHILNNQKIFQSKIMVNMKIQYDICPSSFWTLIKTPSLYAFSTLLVLMESVGVLYGSK